MNFYGTKKETISVSYRGNFLIATKIVINDYRFSSLHNLFFSGVYIRSRSKGLGFCGTVKRYSFSLNRKSHGTTKSYRKPGSIGMCQDPGRVFKGKKMPGHKGNSFFTIKSSILFFSNYFLLLKGSIPGCYNSKVSIFFK